MKQVIYRLVVQVHGVGNFVEAGVIIKAQVNNFLLKAGTLFGMLG